MEPTIELSRLHEEAESILKELPHEQKSAIIGVIACVITKFQVESQREWSKDYLRIVVCDYLALSDTQFEAIQKDTCTNEMDPAPYLIFIGSDETRWKIVDALLTLTAVRGKYDSRTRVIFRYLAHVFDIDWHCVTLAESILGARLFSELSSIQCTETKKGRNFKDWRRNAKIGAAALAGATLLAVTGGLAAPAIASGFTALGGAGIAVGGALTTAGVELNRLDMDNGLYLGAAATTALFGAAGAGLAGFKADRRFLGVQQFSFDLTSTGDGMNVFICISGWIENVKGDENGPDFRRPWGDSREYLRQFYMEHNPEKVKEVDALLDRNRGREDEFFLQLDELYRDHHHHHHPDPQHSVISPSNSPSPNEDHPDEVTYHFRWRWKETFAAGDQYCLHWEDDVLRRVGNSMRNYVTKEIFNFTRQKVVQATIFGALLAAVALPAVVVKACNAIDGDWVLAMDRADKAGKLLAKVLLSKKQGCRPVSLIGFSFGARLIHSCLTELAAKGEEGRGIIENAVLLGTPVSTNVAQWNLIKPVVAGRLINGFSLNDWIMGIMYRYQGWALSVAGICPVESSYVENVDLSNIIGGHLEYRDKIKLILDVLNLESSSENVNHIKS